MLINFLDTLIQAIVLGILLLSFLLALGLVVGTRGDEAFYLISLATHVVKRVINVVKDHIYHVLGAKCVCLKVGSVDCGLDTLFLASSS